MTNTCYELLKQCLVYTICDSVHVLNLERNVVIDRVELCEMSSHSMTGVLVLMWRENQQQTMYSKTQLKQPPISARPTIELLFANILYWEIVVVIVVSFFRVVVRWGFYCTVRLNCELVDHNEVNIKKFEYKCRSIWGDWTVVIMVEVRIKCCTESIYWNNESWTLHFALYRVVVFCVHPDTLPWFTNNKLGSVNYTMMKCINTIVSL